MNKNNAIRGQKDFLASLEIGKTIEYEGPFPWRKLQQMAYCMKSVYGCEFKFKTVKGIKLLTRLR